MVRTPELHEHELQDVDTLIDQICRNDASVFAVAISGQYTAAQRVENPRLDATCKALERRRILLNNAFKIAMQGHS
jgi:hypothetical protein